MKNKIKSSDDNFSNKTFKNLISCLQALPGDLLGISCDFIGWHFLTGDWINRRLRKSFMFSSLFSHATSVCKINYLKCLSGWRRLRWAIQFQNVVFKGCTD